MMGLGWRKVFLTTHVTSSVGWLGSVGVFLALAVVGLESQDLDAARSAYIAMEAAAWYVIVPFAVASLATGLVVSLGGPWGLFRHYWVLIKLAISLVSTSVLLLHLRPIGFMAEAAATLSVDDLRAERLQLVVASAGGIVALLVAQVLSIYKPRGLTPYGWRMEREERGRPR